MLSTKFLQFVVLSIFATEIAFGCSGKKGKLFYNPNIYLDNQALQNKLIPLLKIICIDFRVYGNGYDKTRYENNSFIYLYSRE